MRIAIIGATGAVGHECLKLLESTFRHIEISSLGLFGTERSVGSKLTCRGETFTVQATRNDLFQGYDVALFSAGGDVARHLVPYAKNAGCVVIDNSSAFRSDPKVPLVVPEINGHALQNHQKIIANPNCTTTIALMALYPLHRDWD